jgi:hypothetical protein
MWMDVYNAETTKGQKYVQGGGCATVWVAGLIQGGGFGSFSENFSTAAAGLLQAEVEYGAPRRQRAGAGGNMEHFFACVAESQGLHDCFSAGPGTLTYNAHSAEPECLTPARSRSRKCGVTERSFGDRCPRRPSRISNEKALRKPWFHFIEECREGRPTVMLRIRRLKVPTGRCKLTTWP